MNLLAEIDSVSRTTSPNWDPGLWSAAGILLWLLVGMVVYAALGASLRSLIDALAKRLIRGGGFKGFGFDLPEIRVPQKGIAPGSAIKAHPDSTGAWARARDQLYNEQANIFIAHQLAPSDKRGQLYDILIYLIPHADRGGSLKLVSRVEYFLGSAWGGKAFESSDAGKRFAVAVSAYGSGFLCTARIHLTESQSPIETWRYIDFEMGALGEGGVATRDDLAS